MESLRTKIEEALNKLVLYRRRRWQRSAQAELLLEASVAYSTLSRAPEQLFLEFSD